jgi:hypothetical protein
MRLNLMLAVLLGQQQGRLLGVLCKLQPPGMHRVREARCHATAQS